MLILSYFDPIRGPIILLYTPESVDEDDIKMIPSLMDNYEKGFFIHIYEGFKCANYVFEIHSPYARGNKEIFLISILIDEGKLNFKLSKDLLKKFKQKFKKISNVYEAFKTNSKTQEKNSEKLLEVKLFFQTFYNLIPKTELISLKKTARVLVFGPSGAGKTIIINSIQKKRKEYVHSTSMVEFSRITFKKYSLLVYDTPGRSDLMHLWVSYLRNKKALVFVLDASKSSEFDNAKKILFDITQIPTTEKIPLLIFFNKIDLETEDLDSLKKKMGINEMNKRPVMCFLTSATNNRGIVEGFNWLISRLEKKIFSYIKDLSIIFSRWEKKGNLKNLIAYPQNVFKENQDFLYYFSPLLETIFNIKDFKRTTLLLPLIDFSMKTSIYIDYVLKYKKDQENITPVCLLLFYNEETPNTIIERFNTYLLEEFYKIKTHFTNQTYIKNNIEKIHSIIVNSLTTLKPTIQALRIEEIRYQNLFNSIYNAILIIDRKTGLIIDANKQVEKLFQVPINDIIGFHLSKIKFIKQNENLEQYIQNYHKIKREKQIPMKIKDLDDNNIPIKINIKDVQIGGKHLIQCIFYNSTILESSTRKKKII